MTNKRYELLLKNYWSAEDISMYFELSHPTAQQVRNEILDSCGCIEADKNKDKKSQRVKANDVIKYFGGISVNDELDKYEKLVNIKKGEFEKKWKEMMS